jgi:spermidine synthase
MRQPLNHPIDEIRPMCCNDGHSTAFWARSGLEVHSVDINPGAVKIAAAGCKDFPNVKVACADGIAFLQDFPGTIDFLFLDAWDALKGTPYAEKHLEAYEVARKKLNPSALIVIDDTDIAFGGKGRLAIPAIIRDGFDLLTTGRQTMLLRIG